MTKSKNTKKALLASVLSMMLCMVMLVGSTFAWFTDSVTSGKNKIVAGNLDVELEYSTDGSNWDTVTVDTNLFKPTEGEGATLWEPGHTEYVYLRVRNAGSLALRYQFVINVFGDENGGAEKEYTNIAGEKFKLSEHLVFSQKDGTAVVANREELWIKDAAAEKASMGDLSGLGASGVLYADTENTMTLAVYMPTQVGNEANQKTELRVKEGTPTIYLGLTLNATQTPHETDSFGNDYDSFWDGSADNEGLAQNTNDQEKTVNINTPEQLAALAQKVNSGNTYAGYTIKLTSDINLGNIPWTPIGDYSSNAYFNGSFDGQGHTIKNLNCEAYVAGLFGRSEWKPEGPEQLIKNFTVENATVVADNKQDQGGWSAAVVYGDAGPQSDFEDITVKGNIIVATDKGAYYMAAIVAGRNWYGTMNNCHVYANEGSYIECQGDKSLNYTAGLAAWHGEGAKLVIQNSSSNIDIRGVYATAGLLGIAQYGNMVENCKVGLNEDGTMRRVNISRSITTGDNQDKNDIGGIVGMITDNVNQPVRITNCTGQVHFDIDFGIINHDGVVGNNYSGNDSALIVINNCNIDWTRKQ